MYTCRSSAKHHGSWSFFQLLKPASSCLVASLWLLLALHLITFFHFQHLFLLCVKQYLALALAPPCPDLVLLASYVLGASFEEREFVVWVGLAF
jgi:hypothetical protein